MPKPRVALIVAAICVVVVAVLVVQLQTAGRVSQNQTSFNESEGLNEILQALTVSPFSVTLTNNRESLMEGLKRKQEAVEKLRANSSAFLPRLMEEVYVVGRVEATNRSAAAAGTARLASAFEVLGGEARPLLPKLKNEFNAGRSIGPCVVAFQHIGGTDCGLILVSCLTNSDPRIRNAAMSALSSFATNREVALSAVPLLVLRLKDNSEFTRAQASSVLGSLRVEAEAVIPPLLQVAKGDSDFVVRCMAIKAIGRFGTNAAVVKPDLETIATSDQEARVRRIASVAIRAVSGEIPPDKVQ